MNELLGHLQDSSASFRRMMSSTLVLLCIHSKVPQNKANWIISKLIGKKGKQGCMISTELHVLFQEKLVPKNIPFLMHIDALILSRKFVGF